MDHSQHNSAQHPVDGCKECDKEINRPLQRRHGLGKSSSIVQPPEKKDKDGN